MLQENMMSSNSLQTHFESTIGDKNNIRLCRWSILIIPLQGVY